MIIRTYIGLGSNLAHPVEQIQRALLALQTLPDTPFAGASSLYRTSPLGPQDQPDFINAVARLDTLLSPEQLLVELQSIEQQQGRQRTSERWGPRTLDLDIILYGDLILNTPTLTIPHSGLLERDFWLIPLFELAPDLIFPNGMLLKDCLNQNFPSPLDSLSKI
jgi:2-amino-4-hydroxy-6-hydroxymethyldihydropteridine diphosphokinase